MQGQQYKWPQRVTTGSWAESKQMLQSKLPLEFSEAASEAEMAFHFFWSETSPSDSCCAASSGKSCSKAMRSVSKQGPLSTWKWKKKRIKDL